jgi:hypothetical protein
VPLSARSAVPNRVSREQGLYTVPPPNTPVSGPPRSDDSLTGRPTSIIHVDGGFLLRYGTAPAAAVLSALQAHGYEVKQSSSSDLLKQFYSH